MPLPAENLSSTGTPLGADETPRSIALGERVVHYVLRRAKRRSIGLTIDHRGLRVGAPRRATLSEVEALILRHRDWVAQKLDEWQQRPQRQSLTLTDGLQLPLLGSTLELRLTCGSNRVVWNEAGPVRVLTLCLRAPSDAGHLLEKALREKALSVFSERYRLFASRLGVTPPPLSLSSARTRWGSCSLRSGIRLNWRLIFFPLDSLDYVIAHELAHLREMNHSQRFWMVVEGLYPNFRQARDELKKRAADVPLWSIK